MAIIKLKDLDKHIQAKINKVLDDLTSPKNLEKLGEEIKQEIFLRTKLGYGVDKEGAPQKKLKPLTEGYKKARKGHLSKKLSSDTTPARSNLTLSGDMLNDMEVTVKGDKVSIGFGSKHSKDKVEWNSINGRDFFHISKAQIMALTKQIKDRISQILKKI